MRLHFKRLGDDDFKFRRSKLKPLSIIVVVFIPERPHIPDLSTKTDVSDTAACARRTFQCSDLFFIKCNLDICNSRFLRAPRVALPTRICHAEPLARPTVVINCVVLHRFTPIGPAVRGGVCGPAPQHPPCCVRRLNKQARGGACTSWSGEGFVGARSAHTEPLCSPADLHPDTFI